MNSFLSELQTPQNLSRRSRRPDTSANPRPVFFFLFRVHGFPPKPPRARDRSRESRRYLSLFPLSNLLPNLYPIIFLPLIHRQSLVLANFFSCLVQTSSTYVGAQANQPWQQHAVSMFPAVLPLQSASKLRMHRQASHSNAYMHASCSK